MMTPQGLHKSDVAPTWEPIVVLVGTRVVGNVLPVTPIAIVAVANIVIVIESVLVN